MKTFLYLALLVVTLGSISALTARPTPTAPKPNLAIIAYYAGDATGFQQYPTEKFTHSIYSFLHHQGTAFTFDKPADKATGVASRATSAIRSSGQL